jgi:hypothetical protein
VYGVCCCLIEQGAEKVGEGITSSQEFLIKAIILDRVGAHDQIDLGGDIDVLFVVHDMDAVMKKKVLEI